MVNSQGWNDIDSFFYSILYTLRDQLTQKIDNELKEDVGAEISDEIYLLKEIMRLDLDILNFENQCFQINRILNKNNFFLRVFELKEKFRALIKQDPKKKRNQRSFIMHF